MILSGDVEIVEAVLPDVFSYQSVLYVGARPGRQILAGEFKARGATVDLLEIWGPNFDELSKTHRHIFDEFILGDVRDIGMCVSKTYNVICWWHGPEHIYPHEMEKTLRALENFATDLVFVGCPYGNYPQGPVGGNIYETHLQALTPEDFIRLGWSAVSFGEKDNPSAFVLAWKRKNKED